MPRTIYGATGAVQSVQYSWQKTVPRTITGYQPTGETESLQFHAAGDSAQSDLRTLANSYFATASNTLQVSASISRADGGVYTLSITRTYYEAASNAAAVGTAETTPSYTLTLGTASASILTHPLIQANAGASWLEPTSAAWAALIMLAKGASWYDYMTYQGQEDSIGQWLTHGGVPAEVSTLVAEQSEWLEATCTLTASWVLQDSDPIPTIEKFPTIQTPPGPFPALVATGRNWLFMGASLSRSGDKTTISKTYQLSGPGGWNPAAYPSS